MLLSSGYNSSSIASGGLTSLGASSSSSFPTSNYISVTSASGTGSLPTSSRPFQIYNLTTSVGPTGAGSLPTSSISAASSYTSTISLNFTSVGPTGTGSSPSSSNLAGEASSSSVRPSASFSVPVSSPSPLPPLPVYGGGDKGGYNPYRGDEGHVGCDPEGGDFGPGGYESEYNENHSGDAGFPDWFDPVADDNDPEFNSGYENDDNHFGNKFEHGKEGRQRRKHGHHRGGFGRYKGGCERFDKL